MTAKRNNATLVAIPFLFGAQQTLEGVQWLCLHRGQSSNLAGYGFLFFALILWPIYVPTAVFVLDQKKRAALKWFMLLGALVALYFSLSLWTQPLSIYERAGSIRYGFHFRLQWLVVPAYLTAILGALYFSSFRIFRWFGFVISVFALISWLLYAFDFLSVWCFFAAIVSSMFYAYSRLQI